MLARVSAALGVAIFTCGCSSESCDRTGCDAVRELATGISVGIAGVVAAGSDVVSNGCQECPFAQARVEIWRVESPTTPEADVASTVGRAPLATISAAPYFRKTLDQGTYVVCADASCTEASVQTGLLTTVNVMKKFGPTSFWTVGESGAFTETDGIMRPAGS
jgi:hypothetical protein